MVETRKPWGRKVANEMLEVGMEQKRTVKLGRETFECRPLSWKQSTVLFGLSEFEPGPHTAIGSCTGVSVLVLTCGLTKFFWINSKTCINLMVTYQDLAHYCYYYFIYKLYSESSPCGHSLVSDQF